MSRAQEKTPLACKSSSRSIFYAPEKNSFFSVRDAGRFFMFIDRDYRAVCSLNKHLCAGNGISSSELRILVFRSICVIMRQKRCNRLS